MAADAWREPVVVIRIFTEMGDCGPDAGIGQLSHYSKLKINCLRHKRKLQRLLFDGHTKFLGKVHQFGCATLLAHPAVAFKYDAHLGGA